jgi:hypothetical protein
MGALARRERSRDPVVNLTTGARVRATPEWLVRLIVTVVVTTMLGWFVFIAIMGLTNT